MKRYLKDKTCPCGKVFRPDASTRKYCSYPCALKNRRKRGMERKCATCKKVFYVRPGGIDKIKYCSMPCMGKGKVKGKPRPCKNCGKIYSRPPSQEYWRGKSLHCSMSCKTQWHRKTVKPHINTIDGLWSQLVKKRAGNKCEYCGRTTSLNAHHIFSRSNRATRWDEMNGLCVCVEHHIFGNFSAHKSPIEFVEWLKEKRGLKWYQELRRRAATIVKPNYIAIRDELEKKLSL